MKKTFFALLSLFTVLGFSPVSRAEMEDANQLPWNIFTTDVADPSASAVKLLKVLKIGPSATTVHIKVPNCGNDITAVKLRVSNAGVNVQSFGLVFTDRAVRDFTVNRTFPAGTESPWIDLGFLRALDSRCVAQITATGQSTGGTATIELFANMK